MPEEGGQRPEVFPVEGTPTPTAAVAPFRELARRLGSPAPELAVVVRRAESILPTPPEAVLQLLHTYPTGPGAGVVERAEEGRGLGDRPTPGGGRRSPDGGSSMAPARPQRRDPPGGGAWTAASGGLGPPASTPPAQAGEGGPRGVRVPGREGGDGERRLQGGAGSPRLPVRRPAGATPEPSRRVRGGGVVLASGGNPGGASPGALGASHDSPVGSTPRSPLGIPTGRGEAFLAPGTAGFAGGRGASLGPGGAGTWGEGQAGSATPDDVGSLVPSRGAAGGPGDVGWTLLQQIVTRIEEGRGMGASPAAGARRGGGPHSRGSGGPRVDPGVQASAAAPSWPGERAPLSASSPLPGDRAPSGSRGFLPPPGAPGTGAEKAPSAPLVDPTPHLGSVVELVARALAEQAEQHGVDLS